MGKILCLCGRKGSGKNTLANFLHGYQLKSCEKIDSFDLDVNGDLFIKGINDKNELAIAKIDIMSRDLAFAEWASYNVWPFIKAYSFAEALKEICVGLFNIPREMLYGTEAEKNQLTHLRWENMPGIICLSERDTGPMTAREFMQFFGTEIMRKMYQEIWARHTLANIVEEDSQLAVITDGRFLNEIDSVKSCGGKSIYLTKRIDDDTHASEASLSAKDCDVVIDNQNQTLSETCVELVKVLEGWGWME